MTVDIRVRVSDDGVVMTLIGPKPGYLYSIPAPRGEEAAVLEILLDRARKVAA